jgi:PHD/YefM family antitoxin component YafN of YafNO toxin-antitoxin module
MNKTRTVPARELKRRGISSLDELLHDGPVHVIKNDQPAYVILTEGDYQELLDGYEQAQLAQIRESLEDIKAGRVKKAGVDDLIRELGLEP